MQNERSVPDYGKLRDLNPKQYRLMQKLTGELVLQGYFGWRTYEEYGGDWVDLPTIKEES